VWNGGVWELSYLGNRWIMVVSAKVWFINYEWKAIRADNPSRARLQVKMVETMVETKRSA
jgi:hypothetical protein